MQKAHSASFEFCYCGTDQSGASTQAKTIVRTRVKAAAGKFEDGCDGKDHSAAVVIEQRVVYLGKHDPLYFEPDCELRMGIRLIERIPLGNDYDKFLDELVRLGRKLAGEEKRPVTVLDGSGATTWTVKSVNGRTFAGRVYVSAITGGLEERDKDGYTTMPRTDLLHTLFVALETGRLEVGEMEEWGLLREELLGMRRTYGDRGMRFDTDAEQDDLVFAAALALWGVNRHLLPTSGPEVRRRVLEGLWV